jgi:hypothetical protein
MPFARICVTVESQVGILSGLVNVSVLAIEDERHTRIEMADRSVKLDNNRFCLDVEQTPRLLKEGAVRLLVRASGYRSVLSDEIRIDHPNQSCEVIVNLLDRAPTYRVIAVDPKGQPAANVRVSLMGTQGDGLASCVLEIDASITGEDGSANLTLGAPVAAHGVLAVNDELGVAWQAVSSSSGADYEHLVNMKMSGVCSILGDVSTGGVASSSVVFVTCSSVESIVGCDGRRRPLWEKTVQTDGIGHYRLDKVPSGRMIIGAIGGRQLTPSDSEADGVLLRELYSLGYVTEPGQSVQQVHATLRSAFVEIAVEIPSAVQVHDLVLVPQ